MKGNENRRLLPGMLLLVMLLCALGLGSVLYPFLWEPTTVEVVTDEDTGLSVTLEELGTAFFYGPSRVRVTIRDANGWIKGRVYATIANDGATLTEQSMGVEWRQTAVLIYLSGSEQKTKTYRVDLN